MALKVLGELTLMKYLVSIMSESGREIDIITTCFCNRCDKLNQTPMQTPLDMPPEVSSQSPSPKQHMGGTQNYIEP
jgi:hypothetical protein